MNAQEIIDAVKPLKAVAFAEKLYLPVKTKQRMFVKRVEGIWQIDRR